MKVILLQELQGRGAEGDVIDVARGFAVNYLFPRKIAIEATSGNLKQLEQRMHNIRKRDEARLDEANQLAASLEGKTVTIGAKVGEEGRLFGSVTSPMVEEAIREQLGVEVDRRRIETHGHIKEVGEHPVEISIYRDVKASITVNVVPEGAPIPTTVLTEEEGVTEEGEAFVEIAEEPAEPVAEASAEDALEQPAAEVGDEADVESEDAEG